MSKKSITCGSDALNRVAAFIKRFVSLSDAQAIAVALWVAHTHALAAAETTPYLNITSAEKQCGKTRLLEVLSLLVVKPWLTGSVSKAVLVRKLDALIPTLLLDETDAAFGGDRDYSEALRQVLNLGHSRDGVASVCEGQPGNIVFKDFRVFGAKAIAGIGKLPDTVADRSIPIRMKRRAPSEEVERFRRRLLKAESEEIRTELGDWVTANISRFKDAKPALPDSLSDRQQDGCEPLLAIVDAAGGDWPDRGRKALVEILTGEAAEDDSIGVRLLADIRTAFNQRGMDRLSTADLRAALCDLDPQWLEVSHGKEISAASLSRLLKRFGIHHRKLRLDGGTLWGYTRHSFEDAWTRYLSRNLEQMEQSSNGAEKTRLLDLEHGPDVPARENAESPVNTQVVPDVPVRSVHLGRANSGQFRCYVHGTTTQWWERPPTGSGHFVCSKCHPEPEGLRASEVGFGKICQT